MSYFYSEPLTYCDCIMPRETAWESLHHMGQLELVHIEHRDVDYTSPYIKMLKRCEESISKVTDIRKFVEEIKHKLRTNSDDAARDNQGVNAQPKKCLGHRDLLRIFNRSIVTRNIHGHLYFNLVEDEIRAVHEHLWGQKKQMERIQAELETKLQTYCLFKTLISASEFKTIVTQMKIGQGVKSIFEYRCAMINTKDRALMERAVFRISRGHCWVKFFEIGQQILTFPEKYSEMLSKRVVCLLMFESGEQGSLLSKIVRLLTAFETTGTISSLSPHKFQDEAQLVLSQINELQSIENLSFQAIQRYLHRLSEDYEDSNVPMLEYLQAYSKKEKEIYSKLASMVQAGSFLRFSIFLPTTKLSTSFLHITLTPKQASPSFQKPTLIPTTQLLSIPQQILNTYGVPSYGQFNPAPLYIVTFAFFIGVMFGDVGHMLMMLPYLIWARANKKDNPWVWIVVFFVAYCGLIYGEFCGLKLVLFRTCYHQQVRGKAFQASNCVYPVGLDPVWSISVNDLQFVNSFKMKLAVILGVAHMLLGLVLRIVNNMKGGKYLSLATVAIPQLVFMLCTFFYMDVLIIYKWLIPYTRESAANAPSIIGTMIQVFAGFGQPQPTLWKGQQKLEHILKITAFSMIPIMLIGVPLGAYCFGSRKKSQSAPKTHRDENFNDMLQEKADIQSHHSSEQGISDPESLSLIENSQHQEPLSQIIVHSMIETIEYLLSTISNTASYLRLWALSLAHSQLSQVLFTLILQPGLAGGYPRILMSFFTFIVFYSATFGVLVCMDSLECFLHALRLHWVEFQSKFYEGKGYKYEAFGFKSIEVTP